MSETGWLRRERSELGAERLLDAAAELFAEQGVGQTSMGDVARKAGCSRATVYRYFDDRGALRVAFVHREARRVAATVGTAVGGIDDPSRRMVEAIMRALREVRGQPALYTWFTSGNLDVTRALVGSSDVIEGMASALLGTHADARARAWLVRMVVSLILLPATDDEEERAWLERFVVPPLCRESVASGL